MSCSVGSGTWGLYVDGAPVPGTRRNFVSGTFTGSDTLLGVTALPAGSHTIQLGFNCTAGNVNAATTTALSDLGGVLLSG